MLERSGKETMPYPPSLPPLRPWLLLLVLPALVACGAEEDDTPPPPTNTAPFAQAPAPAPAPGQVVPAAPGQVVPAPPVEGAPAPPQAAAPGQGMVTVIANSNPPGALVTGGGRVLGTTPLTQQVPVPAPLPGQTQTFPFTFTLDGYQPATLQASPVNGTISITAALAPMVQPQAVPGAPGQEPGQTPPSGGEPQEFTVRGRGGGPIFDNHTTRGAATVRQDCVIDRLRVRLRGSHTYYGDLHITLTGPDGRTYSLARGGRQNPFRTHVVSRARGRRSQGQWRLAVADRLNADSGNLDGWTLQFLCR
jgi:hypothetical protein